MRNNLLVYSYVFVFLGILTILMPPSAFSQERELDEQQLEIGRTGIAGFEDNPAVTTEKMLMDKEVKYVAGKDNEWFTEDDAVYEHYQIEHDAAGKIFKRSSYKVGKDMIPFTYDDQLQNFQLFEYGFDGKLLKETSFDGQDANKKYAKISTTVYKYDAEGKKIKTIRQNPKNQEIQSMTFVYSPTGQLVQDVEYVGKDIQKYHRFEYDNEGKLIRTMECHVEHDGKGPDGIWFTSDDVISSAKESFYNADGNNSEDHKFIALGADGKWFTDDDVLQYYVLFEFQK